jgi:hypothetical protein
MSRFGISISATSGANYHFPGQSLLCRAGEEGCDAFHDLRKTFARDNNRRPPRRPRRAKDCLSMAKGEVCENDYDKAFEVIAAGKHHTFDSFECAIRALRPTA